MHSRSSSSVALHLRRRAILEPLGMRGTQHRLTLHDTEGWVRCQLLARSPRRYRFSARYRVADATPTIWHARRVPATGAGSLSGLPPASFGALVRLCAPGFPEARRRIPAPRSPCVFSADPLRLVRSVSATRRSLVLADSLSACHHPAERCKPTLPLLLAPLRQVRRIMTFAPQQGFEFERPAHASAGGHTRAGRNWLRPRPTAGRRLWQRT